MKREIFLAIIMVVVMVLVGGCGNQNTEDKVKESETTVSSDATSEEIIESSVEVEQEINTATPEPTDINAMITEKTDDELDLKQYYFSYEDRTMDKIGNQVFSENLFESDDESNFESFITTGKVNLYNINGIRVGYATKDAWIETFGSYDGWYFFYLDGQKRFARVEDVLANSITREQAMAEEQAIEESKRQEASTVKTENPVTNNPVEQPADSNSSVEVPAEQPVESDKYTPEEAVAVYRSLMEAGGITWNPALKDGGSWGTGWIYLDKGQPEWSAEADLESFAMGDSVGNPWTQYYMEVTGSDEDCVYFTQWAD